MSAPAPVTAVNVVIATPDPGCGQRFRRSCCCRDWKTVCLTAPWLNIMASMDL
jgi:hypothetical protein